MAPPPLDLLSLSILSASARENEQALHRLFRIRSICERVIGRLKQDGHQNQGWMDT